MSVGLSTMGKFLPQIGGGDTHIGGAIIPPQTEDVSKPRLSIYVKSLEIKNKKLAPLKIILKCSNSLGV